LCFPSLFFTLLPSSRWIPRQPFPFAPAVRVTTFPSVFSSSLPSQMKAVMPSAPVIFTPFFLAVFPPFVFFVTSPGSLLPPLSWTDASFDPVLFSETHPPSGKCHPPPTFLPTSRNWFRFSKPTLPPRVYSFFFSSQGDSPPSFYRLPPPTVFPSSEFCSFSFLCHFPNFRWAPSNLPRLPSFSMRISPPNTTHFKPSNEECNLPLASGWFPNLPPARSFGSSPHGPLSTLVFLGFPFVL